MSIVVNFSREQLEVQRSMVLGALNMTAADFVRARSTRTLTGAEWQAKENLDTIDFLLGKTDNSDDA